MNKPDKTYTFKHKTKGLGIHNWIKSMTAVRPGTWNVVLGFFKVLIAGSKLNGIPVLGYIYNFLMFFKPDHKRFTRGVILPLNVDLTDSVENVVMPIELMKKAVREASYITIMRACICRDAQKCETYPIDHGCIFIGQGARVLEERKIGRKATVEEALAHIDKGAAAGLVGQSLWIEVEQYVWGMKNEDMHRFLELCFCCPCCCTAFKIFRNSGEDVRQRVRSVGWKAYVDKDITQACGSCKICSQKCPVGAISNPNGLAVVDQKKCVGCGICESECPNSYPRLILLEKTKEDIKEYFWELDLDL